MAEVVVMPALGNSVESSLISEWLVKVGDTVEENTLLCEIETDKSSMDVPAGVSGVVLALLAEEGDDVPVKVPIAVIGEAGEEVDPSLLGPAKEEASDEGTAAEETPAAESTAVATSAPAAAPVAAAGTSSAVSPRARGLAYSQGIDGTALAGSGPEGRVIERDVEAALAAGPGLTKGARVGAEGFVPGRPGTGIGGRVTKEDLANMAAAVPAAETAATPTTAVSKDFPGSYTDVPMKGVRKVIADRMKSSLDGSAQLTLNTTAPADGLLAMRKKFKNAPDSLGVGGITLGDLIAYATAKTLAKYPDINSHLSDGVIRKFDSVHLGIAVDTPRGLLVPTVQFANEMTLPELSAEIKAVASAATEGSIDPSLLSGGTFTVSNLGSFGIESFTPVLNAPQAGILGVGTIFPRAKANADGSVGLENRLGLSLTMDHQVYDGADGARFLKDLVAAIEYIDLTVLG